MANVLIKYRHILYACIAIFLLLSLYSQLQSVQVKNSHDSLASKIPIAEYSHDMSRTNTLVVMIPSIGPYLEVNSITSLFKDMKSVTEKYSKENSAKVFKEMEESYSEELSSNGESIYLYNYNSTVKSMLNYFKNYSLLDSDSDVVKSAKAELSKNLNLLQLISIFKIVSYILLFIISVIGVFVFKGRYSDKGNIV